MKKVKIYFNNTKPIVIKLSEEEVEKFLKLLNKKEYETINLEINKQRLFCFIDKINYVQVK